MSNTMKNILFAVMFLSVLGLGYYLYTQQGSAVLNIAQDDDMTRQLNAETASFMASLNTLSNVDLQVDLFDDPRFSRLRSYQTDVPELNTGRSDPFSSVFSN